MCDLDSELVANRGQILDHVGTKIGTPHLNKFWCVVSNLTCDINVEYVYI